MSCTDSATGPGHRGASPPQWQPLSGPPGSKFQGSGPSVRVNTHKTPRVQARSLSDLQEKKHKEGDLKRKRELRCSSIGGALAWKARESEFNTQHSHKTGVGVLVCNLCIWGERIGNLRKEVVRNEKVIREDGRPFAEMK